MSKALQEQVDFYQEQLSSLKDMMSRTVAYMEEIEQELNQKNTEIDQSIHYAKNIQENLLPDQLIFERIFSESFYTVRQRNNIGGDMVFAKEFDDVVCFGLMDCTGHGIPGALISMIGHTFITDSIQDSNKLNPADTLKKVNKKFRRFFHRNGSKDFLYDSMEGILCSYHRKTHQLTYCTAGRPLWVKKNNWQVIKSEKKAIGGMPKGEFKNHSVQLEKGDELFISSDGLQDQFGGPRNKKFMSKQILQILSLENIESFTERTQLLTNRLNEWQGEVEQTDDISFLAIKL